MNHEWVFQETTPAGGQCYRAGRYIKIMYSDFFKVYKVPEDLSLCAGNGELIEDSRNKK